MPAKSEKQRRFMGAELGRKRAGKKTRTGMTEGQLSKYANKGNPEGEYHQHRRVNDNKDGECFDPIHSSMKPMEEFPGNPKGSSEDGGRAANVDPYKLP